MQENRIDETTATEFMWLLLAQFGVIIDDITEDGEIFFTVPDNSEWIGRLDAPLYNIGVGLGSHDVMMAGDILIQMANGFFEENGLKPHGGIRNEYWTEFKGQLASGLQELDIKKEGPQLLRL